MMQVSGHLSFGKPQRCIKGVELCNHCKSPELVNRIELSLVWLGVTCIWVHFNPPYCDRHTFLLEFPGLLKLDLPTIALEMDPECNEAMDTP